MRSAVFLMLVGIGLACLSSTAAASGGQRTFGKIYTQCGIGAMIAPETPAVAAVTNVTWDLGTTAISSNISSPSTCRGQKTQMASMIYTTYPSLESDVASGAGENLDSLATLAGCANGQRSSFVHTLRSRFSQKASVAGYVQQSRRSKAAALFSATQNARRAACGQAS